MTHSGPEKKWFKGKGFGSITPDDGGDDVFVRRKQGSTVSYDTEYVKRIQGIQLDRNIQWWWR